MTDLTLRGSFILVVEDEYLLAHDICTELVSKNAVVLGPAATVDKALALIREADQLSGAILDINLRGETAFVLADELIERDVPFVFSTGYNASAIPDRFRHVTRCEKPVLLSAVVRALGMVAPA